MAKQLKKTNPYEGIRLDDLYSNGTDEQKEWLRQYKALNPYAGARPNINPAGFTNEGITNIVQQADFGESSYDEEMPGYNYDYFGYEDLRGERQSGLNQIKNGVLKGIITTGTTYVDMLAGLPVGIMTAVAEGKLSGIWDNVVTNAMKDVTDWSEEALPNYYTQQQKDSPWYSPVNLFSANFLGDKLIKNFGFSGGAALGMRTISKVPKLLPKLASNGNVARAINSAETAFVGAVGEGSIEALNNTQDWANEQRSIVEAERSQNMAALDLKYAQLEQSLKEQYGNSEMFQILMRGLITNYQNEANQINNTANKKVEALQNQIDTQGNLILAGNIPVLWGSNILTLGKMLARGYKATASSIDKFVTKNAKGLYESTLTGGKQALRYIKTPILEGFEEMNQAVISTAAGNRSTDYYEMSIDPNKTEVTKNYLGYLWDGLKQTYGDINRYEEFVIGMLSSGISDIVLGQGKALKEEKQHINDAVQRANIALNNFSTQSLLHYMNRQQVLEDQKIDAAIMNDKKKFKDAELAQVASAVTAFAEIGKIEDLKALIDTNLNNLSDAELDDLADELQPQGVEEANFFKVMTYDQRRDYIKKQRDIYHKVIDMYNDANDKIVSISGTVFTPEEVSELTYYRVRADLAADRQRDLVGTIEKKINDTLQNATEDDIEEIAQHVRESLHLGKNETVDTSAKGLANLLIRTVDTTNEKNKDWFDKYFPQQDLFTDIKDVQSLREDVLQYNKTLTDFIKNPNKLKDKRKKSRDKIINQKEQEQTKKEKAKQREQRRKAMEEKFDKSTLAEFDDDDLDYDTQRKLKDAYQRKRDEGKTKEEALSEIREELEDTISPISDDGTESSQEERERKASQIEKAYAKLDNIEKRISEVTDDDSDIEPPIEEVTEEEETEEPENLTDRGTEEIEEPTTQEEVIKSNKQSVLHTRSTNGELFRPQLSEFYLHGIDNETYLDYIEEHPEAIPDGIDTDEYKQYIREVHNYLRTKGAFAYVKQQLKVGDSIVFYTDKELNELSGQTVILIGTKVNGNIQCIGSLPTAIDFKGKSKYPIYNEDKTAVDSWGANDKTLAEAQPNRYKQYQELIRKIKTNQSEDNIVELDKSKVNKLYGGNLSLTTTNHPVSDTFVDTVPIIGVIKNAQLEGVGKAKSLQLMSPVDGRVYVLIPQNNGTYIPALVYSRELKELNNESAYIQYLIKEFQQLMSVPMDSITAQKKSLNKALRIPSKEIQGRKEEYGLAFQFVNNGKTTEHRNLATHLRVSVINKDIVYMIPIEDGKLNENVLQYFIKEVANKTNATTGVDINKLDDENYRKFISAYLYFNILEPHSINDFFTYDAPVSKKEAITKEEVKEEIQKQTPNTKNETFITKDNKIFVKDGSTGVWTYQETGELVPNEVLVNNGLKAAPINLNGQVTSTKASSEKTADYPDINSPNPLYDKRTITPIIDTTGKFVVGHAETSDGGKELVVVDPYNNIAKVRFIGEGNYFERKDGVTYDDIINNNFIIVSNPIIKGDSIIRGIIKPKNKNIPQENDILAAINPNGNRPGYTLKRRPKNFTSETIEPVESEKALYQDIDRLAKILPSFNVNERIQVVQGLIDSVDKNGNPIQVYSNYVDGIIYISAETPKGVLYHEMFHYVSDMLLTDAEKKVLFEEAIKRYGNLDEFDLEEKLAEDFRKFMNNETDNSLKGRLRRLFAKLKSLINKAHKDKDGIDVLFWDIYKNRFNVNSNNINNNFKRILDARQDIRLSYNNLNNETKQYLEQRKISPEAYDKLSGTFKQYLLKCM